MAFFNSSPSSTDSGGSPVGAGKDPGLRSWFEAEFLLAGGVSVAMFAALAGLWSSLPAIISSDALESEFVGSLEAIEQIKLTRTYYSTNVVAKAKASGALTPSSVHKNDPRSIPLPATFVQDISEKMKGRELSILLTSPYPWPNRADRVVDDFQSAAWAEFQDHPEAVFSRVETKDGQRYLRVAVADKFPDQTCVNCHNNDPRSPKRDWKVGDVRGVMEVKRHVEPFLNAAESKAYTIIRYLAMVAAALTLLMFLAAFLYSVSARGRRRSEDAARFLARHDPLTAALNRAYFVERLDEALASGRDADVAVLYIDLDGFKAVNDKFGHAVGDELIRAVVERLRIIADATLPPARLGGDEFAIALCGHGASGRAEAAAGQIVTALCEPFLLSRQRISVSTSVGFALSASVEGGAARLIEAADEALYHAKSSGKNRWSFYSADMSWQITERRRLESLLRTSEPSDIFEIHYQQVVDRSRRIVRFEALLRMNDPAGGRVSPSVFIPIAEETGAIASIGAWVLQRACLEAATWPEPVCLAVNISPAQFRSERGVRADVEAALAASGLDPCRLELEITESLLFNGTRTDLKDLQELRDRGVTIALDDFGVGYSSLGYLGRLPLDRMKVDKSFISGDAAGSEYGRKVLEAVVMIAKQLGLSITAEGVETVAQERACLALGFDQMQGFLFGAATEATELASILLRTTASAGGGAVVRLNEAQTDPSQCAGAPGA